MPGVEIGKVVVVGAGTMGHGIAQVAAQAGCRVTLVDVEERLVQGGRDRIAGNLKKGVEKGKLDASAAEAALSRVATATDVAAASGGADLVIEAVPERLEMKVETFRRAAGAAGDAAILASNTSSLPLTAIAAAVSRPERVVGLHFFNPPHLMPLLEIVRAEQTAPAVVEASLGFARRIGKEPIVVQDSPGFATSRLGLALGLEAMRMLETGVAGVADIDRAMELGYKHPMGPLKLTDLVGLDVRLAIAEHLTAELGERFRPPAILRRMVRAGYLGQKSGRGFYHWDEHGARPADRVEERPSP